MAVGLSFLVHNSRSLIFSVDVTVETFINCLKFCFDYFEALSLKSTKVSIKLF